MNSPTSITLVPSNAGVDFASSWESHCNCLRASLAVSVSASDMSKPRDNLLISCWKQTQSLELEKIHKLLRFMLTHLTSAKCSHLWMKSEINRFCACSDLSSGFFKDRDHSASAGLGFVGFLASTCDSAMCILLTVSKSLSPHPHQLLLTMESVALCI